MWKKLLVAIAGAGLLIASTHLALTTWAKARLNRFEAVWAEELFDGLEPSERFPAREANATARLVEGVAAELGIPFEPQARLDSGAEATPPVGGAPRISPSEEASAAAMAVRAQLFGLIESEGLPGPPLTDALRADLSARAEVIDHLAAALLREEPSWAFDLDRALEISLPDYTGHLALHGRLLVASWAAETEGDSVRAERLLAAASALREGIASDPLIIAQLVAAAELKRELGLLRHLCPTGSTPWSERLADFDLLRQYERVVRLEVGRGMVRGLVRSQPLEELPPLVRPVAKSLGRASLVHLVEAVEGSARELEATVWSTFDAGAFHTGVQDSIPSWNPLARVALVNVFDGWHKAGGAQLSTELTERVLAARAGRWTDGEEPSSVDPSLVWRAMVGEAGEGVGRVEIALFHRTGGRADEVMGLPDGRRAATRFVVDPARCEVDRSAPGR